VRRQLGVHLGVARLSSSELDERLAARVELGGPVGVMFRHGVMEPVGHGRGERAARPADRSRACTRASWAIMRDPA
jgi:hypothetical protein